MQEPSTHSEVYSKIPSFLGFTLLKSIPHQAQLLYIYLPFYGRLSAPWLLDREDHKAILVRPNLARLGRPIDLFADLDKAPGGLVLVAAVRVPKALGKRIASALDDDITGEPDHARIVALHQGALPDNRLEHLHKTPILSGALCRPPE